MGDVLSISVFQVADLTSNNTQVGGEGTITMPLIGAVKAAGLTPRQLEASIAGKLKAKYLQSPQVTVDVAQFNSQTYTVEGAVNRPGQFPISGADGSLLRAIASAQGFDRVADTSNVVIFRMKGNQKTAARFDVEQIRAGTASDPEILSGDVIVVDTSGTRSALRDVLQVLPLAGLFAVVL